MNEQEKQLIEGLVSRVHNAPAPEIDREADALIRNGIGGRPDALYILTQTVLVQEMALNQAMAQIEEMKKRGAEIAPGSGRILGEAVASTPGEPGGWSRQQPATAQAAPPVPSPAPAPQYLPVPPQMGPQGPAVGGGMVSGFLRSAATTAAGVVAGEAAFSVLSGLFGHHSGFGPGGSSGFLGAVSGVSPVSETIVNNYYGGQEEDRSSTPAAARLAGDDAAEGPAPGDADRDADDSYHAATADDSEESDDDSAQDDSALEDSGDDSDSYDDDGGGSFDV
jgi:uncharacterized protein